MTDAMRVWREAHTEADRAGWMEHGAKAAAAVIERAIAEAVEKERAKAEALAEALRKVEEFTTIHGGAALAIKTARAALRAWEEALGPSGSDQPPPDAPQT